MEGRGRGGERGIERDERGGGERMGDWGEEE